MPVTAKLSRHFYERFGDELTNELVEWFNAVDAEYKADLRTFVDDIASRSDARLRQEIGTLRAEMNAGFDRLRAELIKWAFVFFATAALAVIGLR